MTDIDMSMLSDYLVEAAEHLEEMETLLLQLVEEPDNTELLNEIFRPIHSIKGAAQFIGLERSSKLAHRLEDLLDLLRKGQRDSSPEVVELLITARDQIVVLAAELENTQSETSSIDEIVAQLTREIEGAGLAQEEAQQETLQKTPNEKQQAVTVTESDTVEVADYKEENDQELFSIFIENLREKIDLLRTQAAGLESAPHKAVLLARCAENLLALQSAANYMGYEELTSLYTNWLEDIDAVQQALANNEDVPHDFMDGYLSEILSLFPQIDQGDLKPECLVSENNEESLATETNQQIKQDELNQSSPDMDMDLLSDYLLEAAEHLQEMESLLLQLADKPENTELLNEIFRPIHSIKGAAQFTGLDKSSRLTHRLEDLLDLLRNGERSSNPEVVELLISGRDLIACLADELENTQSEISSIDDMVAQITTIIEATETSVGNVESSIATSSVPNTDASENVANASTYTEENDEELYSIFFENLREKIDLLHTQSAGLANAPDKAVLLVRCTESLQALQSAANYMGYEELISLYKNWLEDIEAAQQSLANKQDIPNDFMDDYLSEVVSLFPKLDAETEKSNVAQRGLNTNDSQVDNDLHESLSNALEVAGTQTDDVEYELLHGVFEEMITEREEASADTHLEIVISDSDDSTEKVTVDTKSSETEKPESRKESRRTEDNDRRAVDRRSNESVLKKSVRVDADKIDSLINQVGELVVDRAFFYQLYDDMRGLQKHFKDEIGLDQKEMKQIRAFTYRMGEAIASLSRTSNELQEGVMKVRMLPISQLFNRYPRLVHDLTRNNNKKVNLKVEGEDTELDKMVVEKLSDPLIHIIRNAIDHGLEDASERANAEKSETGTLYLKSYHESNQVVVEIRDDGRGIDPEMIKAKVVEKGILSKEEVDRMTPQEVIRLITTAGFSTADEITDTSGRGVGMDIVRKNIEKLNGTMEIESTVGKGTTIKLRIPLTLAIIPAHLIRVGNNMYTIPLANIEETLRINRSETTIIEGTEVVYLRGKTLPIIHLSNLFSTNSDAKDKDRFYVVVVNTGTQKLGLVVDELLGQEEVVIKPLIDYLRDKSGFSGATIVGDGTISLILDVYEIASMTADKQSRRQHDLIMTRNAANANNQAVG